MAKKNLNEDCIFCGDSPCSCEGSTAKKVVKVKAKKPTKATPAAPVPVAPKFKKSDKPERDLSYESALRAVYDIVSPADQRKIDEELSRTHDQDIDRRRAEWVKKHG